MYLYNPGSYWGLISHGGYLAHKKAPTPLGPPENPRCSPTVGSKGWRANCSASTNNIYCCVPKRKTTIIMIMMVVITINESINIAQ